MSEAERSPQQATAANPRPNPRPGPLAGLRVIDLTRLLPGPVATLHLADLGADVIKVEPPGAGDYARTMGAGPAGVSHFYRSVNRNKRGMRLDLSRPEGLAVLFDLVRSADLLVESFRPGVMARLGASYDVLHALHPRLVMGSISGYGQDGPWALQAGHDLNYLAVSGVLDGIGQAGSPPAIPNLQIGDLLGGAMTAAFAMMAACLEAQRTGLGRHVDVAMAESLLVHHLFPLFEMQQAQQPSPRGAGMLTGGQANYAVYPTADGRYLAVAALEEKFWQVFCQSVLQRPDLSERYAEVCHPDLHAEVARLIAADPLPVWQARLAGTDCCVTPVLGAAEALTHPQFVARGMVQGGGTSGLPLQYAPPVRFSGLPPWSAADTEAAPVAADAGPAVLAELGYTAARIAALQASQIL